ncbi:MAG: nitrogenase reductase [Clostridiales bacterium]|nr:nitrogenase reductase [Clostridiales bacterium]MCF8022438.1 nitrogenase reductase [Clostridiales bacterium]
MPKVIVCGRGGSGKSTLVTILAKSLSKRGKVLVVDTDESNLGLSRMLGQNQPEMSLMNSLGGKSVVREKLLASLKGEKTEQEGFFREDLYLDTLPSECVGWNGTIGNLRIGKIEHSNEGCACPMGSITRSFLKDLKVKENEWVITDTEAGVEHFGRGILEGADGIIMVVDTSYESILLAEKAKNLVDETNKKFFVVLNKVDDEVESTLRNELSARGVETGGVIKYSPDINKANFLGKSLETGMQGENVDELVSNIINVMS